MFRDTKPEIKQHQASSADDNILLARISRILTVCKRRFWLRFEFQVAFFSTMLRMFELRPTVVLLSLCGLMLLTAQSALGQDWGYDEVQPSSPAKAGSPNGGANKVSGTKQSIAPPSKATKTAPKSTTAPAKSQKPGGLSAGAAGKLPAAADQLTAADSVSQSWVELFELVACQPLSDAQKCRYAATIGRLTHGPLREELVAIQSFWPAVAPRIKASAEFRESFRSLFKSLLRMQERAKALDEERSAIVAEVLGPERVADLGPPPLTEDAVDAYADMACFLYEQKNPGKTIDATDNRAVFASVVLNKFKDAPTEADKRSMVNFAVTWARFRIIYAEASDNEKARLLGELEKKGTATVAGLSNPTVDHILRNGPWSKLIGRPNAES